MGAERNLKRRGSQTLLDNKREKLPKKLTLQGKQDVLIQLTQKQTEIQESLLEAMGKRDEGLETALKSTAESSKMLNKTLAVGMNMLFHSMQQQQQPWQHSWTQPQQQPGSMHRAPYQHKNNQVPFQFIANIQASDDQSAEFFCDNN